MTGTVTAPVLEGEFVVALAHIGGPDPEHPDLIPDWLTHGGIEPDSRELPVVQVCPQHRAEDEPTDCQRAAAVYEVRPYDARRHGDLLLKVYVRFHLLAGEPAADPDLPADWAAGEGVEVDDEHRQVEWERGRPQTAIVVAVCPWHGTDRCPDLLAGSTRCPAPQSMYAVEVMGADWAGG